jgi:surface protein
MSEKDISEIDIIYDIKEEGNINIFGSEFVKNNKNICKMIIDNKEYEIAEKYNIKNKNNNKLIIKLKGIDKVTNMMGIFYGCSSLSSLPDISKWNTNNVTYMSYMFCGCSSLSSLPDISKWILIMLLI